MVDEYGRITIRDFYTTFAEELRTMEDNKMRFTRYKYDGIWSRLYFNYNIDETENEDVEYAIIFISPLDENESWTVAFEADRCYYNADQLMAISKFINALNKHSFESIVSGR